MGFPQCLSVMVTESDRWEQEHDNGSVSPQTGPLAFMQGPSRPSIRPL